MKQKNNTAFTLVEVMIVVLIVSVLATATIILLNPRTMIGKGVDAQRKTDLNTLKRKLEEFYTDTGCYPRLDQLCYQGGINGTLNLVDTKVISCAICGSVTGSPSFSPYVDRLACDPESPTSNYIYALSSYTERTCPTKYTIYSKLSVPDDLDSNKLGCGKGGCGPTNLYGYDYAVSSPNTIPATTNSFLCITVTDGSCDSCVTSDPAYSTNYEKCLHNPNCQGEIYATYALCKAAGGR